MFIDTSVLIALLTGEPDADTLAQKLSESEHRRSSPLVKLETCAVLANRLDITPLQANTLFDEKGDGLSQTDLNEAPAP